MCSRASGDDSSSAIARGHVLPRAGGHFNGLLGQADHNSAATRSPSPPARPSTCLARMAPGSAATSRSLDAVNLGRQRGGKVAGKVSQVLAHPRFKGRSLGHHPEAAWSSRRRPSFKSLLGVGQPAPPDPQAAVPVNAAACPGCRAQKPPVGSRPAGMVEQQATQKNSGAPGVNATLFSITWHTHPIYQAPDRSSPAKSFAALVRDRV